MKLIIFLILIFVKFACNFSIHVSNINFIRSSAIPKSNTLPTICPFSSRLSQRNILSVHYIYVPSVLLQYRKGNTFEI